MSRVGRDLVERLRSNLPAGAPRERAVLDLCEAVLGAREALTSGADAFDASSESAFVRQILNVDESEAEEHAAALNRILDLLDPGP